VTDLDRLFGVSRWGPSNDVLVGAVADAVSDPALASFVRLGGEVDAVLGVETLRSGRADVVVSVASPFGGDVVVARLGTSSFTVTVRRAVAAAKSLGWGVRADSWVWG